MEETQLKHVIDGAPCERDIIDEKDGWMLIATRYYNFRVGRTLVIPDEHWAQKEGFRFRHWGDYTITAGVYSKLDRQWGDEVRHRPEMQFGEMWAGEPPWRFYDSAMRHFDRVKGEVVGYMEFEPTRLEEAKRQANEIVENFVASSTEEEWQRDVDRRCREVRLKD